MFEELIEGLSKLNEGAKDIRVRYVDSGKVPEEVYNEFLERDRTRSKKYVEWMCARYVESPDRKGHIMDVADAFEQAVRRRKVEDPDIYKLSLEDADRKSQQALKTPSKTEQKKKKKEEGAQKVYEDERKSVYRILTHEASCLYGSNTKWCTTTEGDHYFNSYFYQREADLYYVITKDSPPKKFAVLRYANGKMEVYNELDDEITVDKFRKAVGDFGG